MQGALLASCAPAVPQAAASPEAAPPLRSPDVYAGGRVAFRVRAAHARAVWLRLEGAPPAPMADEGGGVWTITAGPLAPDVYAYSFSIDGTVGPDPANPLFKPNLLAVQSLVEVPGAVPAPWDVGDAPHGVVHHHFYRSRVVGDQRDLYVYTPPGYEPSGSDSYPVLYLLHGFSDDASAWTAVGRAHVVYDNLIAQGRAVPAVVVMPLGYGAPEILAGGFAGFSSDASAEKALRTRNFERFADALLTEVVPFVEQTYRVRRNASARAIAGLSMGGAEALLVGLDHPDFFSFVASFSAGGLGDDLDADFPALGRPGAPLPRLWIACGEDDPLMADNRRLRAWLHARGVSSTDVDTPGAHTWMVWRRNLAEVAPLLFRNAGAAANADAR